ncbi:hypothetical protein LB456_03495 [Psychroflexus sp. CAK57W]|uniref:hypothetical protein n=1 Tax=Psychroflexus curvus TaxID=2873595 RepID=UPI001CCC4947|nr:hypothetical protein [Psychroflexus curvus]MBZ9786512.1 hypothetical protein [Psychroflexus curvus]
MLSHIREGLFGKNILGFLILVFLNSSIDAPDIYLKCIDYNEQETIIELIIEKGLGFEDAFGEQAHDNELPENSASKKIQLDLINTLYSSNFSSFNFNTKGRLTISYLDLIYSQNHSKIFLPPPEFRV